MFGASNRISIFSFALVLSSPGCVEFLCGQGVGELPRAEYYVARELYGEGHILEAADGFRTAIERSRQIGDGRWIDSIPPLVMLGECFYQQGNLASALENYDAALMLALSYPNWVNELEMVAEPLPPLERIPKGIDWFRRSRPTQSVAVPKGIQYAEGMAATPNDGTSTGFTTRLDASEVMRTMGLALLRRWQTLGPLAAHSPLSEPLQQYFAQEPRQRSVWFRSAWSVLGGLNRLPSGQANAVAELRSAAFLSNQFDYFLSPLTLIALAEVEARQRNYKSAISLLQDASLIAGYFEQDFELSVSLSRLGGFASASRRDQLLTSLQKAANWCSKRSGIAFTAASIATAELAVYASEFSAADRLLKQANSVLRGRDIGLPRLNAQSSFVTALLAFAQNRGVFGASNLDNALRVRRGNAQTGPSVATAFQAQMTLDLLSENLLTSAVAEQILTSILSEPEAADWEGDPLATLAAITTPSLPAYHRQLELAAVRNSPLEMLTLMDRVQSQRLYEHLPLGGRLLSWRHTIAADLSLLPDDLNDSVRAVQLAAAELNGRSHQITALVDRLRAGPMPLDERQLPADVKKQFAELEDLAESQENLLVLRSLSRSPLPRTLPLIPLRYQNLQDRLRPGDAVLSFVTTGKSFFGVAIHDQQIKTWQSDKLAEVEKLLDDLLKQIGLVGRQPRPIPSSVTQADAAWRKTSLQLRDILFPSDVQGMFEASQRLIIIPDGKLWYLPFELLPHTSQRGGPLLSRLAITYAPTLSATYTTFRPHAPPASTVGVVGQIFSANNETNQQIADSLLSALPESAGVYLGQKLTAPSGEWLRISSQQLWLSNRISIADQPWETVLIPFGPARQSTLGSWLTTPLASPTSIILPALQSSAGSEQLGDGTDLFLMTCGLLFSGNSSAVLSRWPVGGKSTAEVMIRYLEERQLESSSTALRRAIIAQWPKDYLVATEPALLPTGKNAEALTTGQHPLLWASYFLAGDSVLAPKPEAKQGEADGR